MTTADTAVSANPTDKAGVPITPFGTGVWETTGARTLRIYVAAPTTTTGNYVFNIYSWDQQLINWFSEGQVTVAAAATGDFSGRLFGTAVVTDWCSDYALVLIQTMATNGGSGVGTSYNVVACMEDV